MLVQQAKTSRFEQARRAQSYRVIFHQDCKVLWVTFPTTRSLRFALLSFVCIIFTSLQLQSQGINKGEFTKVAHYIDFFEYKGHSTGPDGIVWYRTWFVRHKSATGLTDWIQKSARRNQIRSQVKNIRITSQKDKHLFNKLHCSVLNKPRSIIYLKN